MVNGDDFKFAATQSEVRKIRSKMREWCDIKVRGVLGSGKRDVRDMKKREMESRRAAV